jgi:hypothetical protein
MGGYKLRELHTISVPATGPARNTRSKAKTSMLPTKDKSPVLKRTTRSTRSKPSVTPNALIAPVHAPAPVDDPEPVDAPEPVDTPAPISAPRRLLFLSPAEREAELARRVKEQQEHEATEQQAREAKERQEVQEAPFLSPASRQWNSTPPPAAAIDLPVPAPAPSLGPASKQWKLSHPKWKL